MVGVWPKEGGVSRTVATDPWKEIHIFVEPEQPGLSANHRAERMVWAGHLSDRSFISAKTKVSSSRFTESG